MGHLVILWAYSEVALEFVQTEGILKLHDLLLILAGQTQVRGCAGMWNILEPRGIAREGKWEPSSLDAGKQGWTSIEKGKTVIK